MLELMWWLRKDIFTGEDSLKDRFSIFIVLILLIFNWGIFIALEYLDEKNQSGTFTTAANVLLPSILGYIYVILDNKNRSKRGTRKYRRTLGFILWGIVSLGLGYCITVFVEQGMWFTGHEDESFSGAEYLKYGIFSTAIFIFMVLMVDLFAKLRDRYFEKRGLVVSKDNEGKSPAEQESSDGRIRITLEDMEKAGRIKESSAEASGEKNEAGREQEGRRKSISEICSISTLGDDEEDDTQA